jgi:DNA repair protein RecN (Recombination protein N)
MLRELLIKNVVLIEETSLFFEKGFTVISGETGAGKTALVTALQWILGEKVDPSKVRNPELRALVQAALHLEKDSALFPLLEEMGIPCEDPLLIEREILPGGRSRALVSGQLVSLAQLQLLAPHLVVLAGQSAHQILKEESWHLKWLDQFAETEALQKTFCACLREQKKCEEELCALQKETESAQITLQRLRLEQEELAAAALHEGEEEELFAEYEQLLKGGESLQKSEEMLQLLEGEGGVLIQLKAATKIAHLLPLAETEALLAQMQTLGREVLYQVHQFQARVESNPERLLAIDERLQLLDRLKKRYGNPLAYQKTVQESIAHLEGLEDRIIEKKDRLQELEQKTSSLAQTLSAQRTKSASRIGPALTALLQTLGMEGAEAEMRLFQTERTALGDEKALLYLKANRGEKTIAVSRGSSGGELARLFLSLTLLLAEKNKPVTMIFDEIDANVGGKTATLVGQKLQELGRSLQVISITHFPQLAQLADHHIRIAKTEQKGRTIASAELLDEEGRAVELGRMRG